MHATTIFPEVLDTVRTTADEVAIAQAFLKLLVLTPGGALLTTTHAIDSSALLDPSTADDYDFLTMLQRGRVRVARWADGKGPAEAFRAALALAPDKYQLSAWPELQDPARRSAVAAVWNGSAIRVGDADIDARIDRARRLHAAVQTCESKHGRVDELPRGDEFGREVEKMPRMIDTDLPRAMHDAAAALAVMEGKNSRSRVYERIESDSALSDAGRVGLKDLVDGLYNGTVARSLKLPYLSVRRTWPGRNPYHVVPSESLQVSLLRPDVTPTILAPASWRSLRTATEAMQGATKEEAAAAFGSVLQGIASRGKKTVIYGGAGVAGAAAGLSVLLQGGAHEWVWAIVSAIAAYCAGEVLLDKLGQRFDDRWIAEQTHAFHGWLDRTQRLESLSIGSMKALSPET